MATFFIVAAVRPLRTLIVFIVVVFIGGALLAPPLYWLAQHFAGQFPKLAHIPFHRFVNRALLGLALIGLWPLLKNLGATSLRDVGLVRPAGQGKNFGGGFLLGLISLTIVAGLALIVGARQFSDNLTAAKIFGRLLSAAFTAIAVAVLEEILYRGGLFGSLRKVFHWVAALLLSSMVYAIVHFFERVSDSGVVTWYSGLTTLGQMLGGFTNWQSVIPGFFNLTLVGMLLGLAYQRTGNLYFSMSLHAGWILCLKCYGSFTKPVLGANVWWWGTEKLIDGWATLPVLAAMFFLFTQLRSQQPQPPLAAKQPPPL